MTAPRRHDPFAPSSQRIVFPRERLLRAGLEEETVEQLAESYGDLGQRRQRELVAFVTRSTDARIRERFSEPEAPTLEQRRALLEQLKGDELRDLLRAQNLPTGGKNAELIDRLLADNQEPPAGEGPDSSEGSGEQQQGESSEGAPTPPAEGQETPAATTAPAPESPEPAAPPAPATPPAAIVGDGAAAEPTAPTGEQGAVQTPDGVTHEGELPASAAEGSQEAPAAPAGAPEAGEQPAGAPAPADGATQTPAADSGDGQPAATEEN